MHKKGSMSDHDLRTDALSGKAKVGGSSVNLSKSKSVTTRQAKSRLGVLTEPNRGKSRSRMRLLEQYVEGEERSYTYRKTSEEPNIAGVQALLSPTPSEVKLGLSNPWAGLNRRTSMREKKRYSVSISAKTSQSKSEAAESKRAKKTAAASMKSGTKDVQSLSIKEHSGEKDSDSITSSTLSGQSKQSKRRRQRALSTSEASPKDTTGTATPSGRSSPASSRDSDRKGRDKQKQRDSVPGDKDKEDDETDSVKRKRRKKSDGDKDQQGKRKHRKHDYEGSEYELPGSRKGHKEHGSSESLYDKDSFHSLHKRKSKRQTSSESLQDGEETRERRKGRTPASSDFLQVGDESQLNVKGSLLDKDRSRIDQGKRGKKIASSGSVSAEDGPSSSSGESSSNESGSSEDSIEKKDIKDSQQKGKERRSSRKSSQQGKKKLKTNTIKKEAPNADTYKDPKRFLLPEIPGVEYNRAKFHGWDFGTKREQTQAETLPDVTDTAADVIETLLNKPRKSMYDLLFRSRADSNYRTKAKIQEGREAPVKPPNALRTYPGFYAVSKPIYQLFQGRKQRLKKEAADTEEQSVPPTSILETPRTSRKTLEPIENVENHGVAVGLGVLPPIAQLEIRTRLPITQYSHETMPSFPETGSVLTKPPSVEEVDLEESTQSSSTTDSVTSAHLEEMLSKKLLAPHAKKPKMDKKLKSGLKDKSPAKLPIAEGTQDVVTITMHGKGIKETPAPNEVYDINAYGIPPSDISADRQPPPDIAKTHEKLPLTQKNMPIQDSVSEDQHHTTGVFPFIAASKEPSTQTPLPSLDYLSKEVQEISTVGKPPSSIPKTSEKPSFKKSPKKSSVSEEVYDINADGMPPSNISADAQPPSEFLKPSSKSPLHEESDTTPDKTVLLAPHRAREPKFVAPAITLTDFESAQLAPEPTKQRGSWDESLSYTGLRDVKTQAAREKFDSLLEDDFLDFRPEDDAELYEDDELADGLELLLNMQGPCANFFNVTRPDLVSLNYAARQGIEELLSFLMYAVVMNRPQNPVDYIIDLMRSIRRLMVIKQESALKIQDDIAYRVCRGTVTTGAPFSGMSYTQEMDILGQTIQPAMSASHNISTVGPLLDIGGLPIDKFWNAKTVFKKV